MKGDRLGEFEELVLLALQVLREDAYAVSVQQYLEMATRRRISIGAVYAALERLEAKQFVRSSMGPATAARGGKPKRLYEVTSSGRQAARGMRAVREQIWRVIEDKR